jgi:hypothetical protein
LGEGAVGGGDAEPAVVGEGPRGAEERPGVVGEGAGVAGEAVDVDCASVAIAQSQQMCNT